MKKLQLLSILLALCLLFSLVGCGEESKHECKHVCEICSLCQDENCQNKVCEKKCKGHRQDYSFSLSTIDGEVDQHTALQKSYLADAYTSIAKYANGQNERSIPEALSLSWTVQATDDNSSPISYYTVKVSPVADFSENVWTYTCTETTVSVYNLMVGYDYYWQVEATLENGNTSTSTVSAFKTAATCPRMIFVEGVTNVRDMGGWQTESGKTVKQGLLFRCGRLNKSSSSEIKVEITENGKKTMLDMLKIKTEIDLRMVSNNEVGGLTSTSPLGDGVQYAQCPMDYTASNLLTGNKQKIATIFGILSNENNYPVIYHCNIGTDRTGIISFLVDGLLGVSEEDLYRDYLMSNFGNIGGSRNVSSIQSNYVNYIKSFDGDTLSQKIYNCLVANDVPADYLDAVIEILG